jgi:lipid II:glycine glycyltransferase (peptidoglycan interpeptide bridge formation enzyme)
MIDKTKKKSMRIFFTKISTWIVGLDIVKIKIPPKLKSNTSSLNTHIQQFTHTSTLNHTMPKKGEILYLIHNH